MDRPLVHGNRGATDEESVLVGTGHYRKDPMLRLSLVSLPLLIAAAFLVGRATRPGDASAMTSARVYTGHFGDVFRVPAAATRCVVSAEAGAANVHCGDMPIGRARYEVVFYKNNLFVYRNGRPHNPVFSARGKP